ncbi:TIGR00725 family protein [candidate division KSB1 bacterium]|nr:TIGR00725 family protein [candidate division KSB1 bacterium]
MPKQPVIGVMGGAAVTETVFDQACELGQRIAGQGWILLNGGRNAGVMLASAKGAKEKKGVTIGILPGADKTKANPYIDIAIATNMADARNLINVLSSDVIIACPGSAGTLSEIALALKNNRRVIALNFPLSPPLSGFAEKNLLYHATTPKQCIDLCKKILKTKF